VSTSVHARKVVRVLANGITYPANSVASEGIRTKPFFSFFKFWKREMWPGERRGMNVMKEGETNNNHQVVNCFNMGLHAF